MVVRLLEADAFSSLQRAGMYRELQLVWGVAMVVSVVAYLFVGATPELRARPMRATTSFAMFCVGAALMLPVTLHAVVAAGVFGLRERDFNMWAGATLLATSAVHLVFAAQVGTRAVQLARGAEENREWEYTGG